MNINDLWYKLLRRLEMAGAVKPDRQGAPKRYKLDPHAAWRLALAVVVLVVPNLSFALNRGWVFSSSL